MNQAVSLANVTRRYGPVLGLNDVTLAVGPGVTGLVGPNAAGKSTLIHLAVGLLHPTAGTVRVLGQELWASPATRARIGYCPDSERVWEWMSGLEFVVTTAAWTGMDRPVAQARAEEALARLELAEAASRPIREYSKGMRQKVKLVQAMLHQPELLVLDEPLNGVDPVSRFQILEELRRLARQGTAILISSHVLHELETVVDQVVLLNRGRLLATGTVDSIRELIDDHPHTVRLGTSAPPRLAALLFGLEGVVSAEIAAEGTLDVRTRNPAVLYAKLPEIALGNDLEIRSVTSPDSNLEAVFRYLVKGGGG
jgi:ABC-2 type transport system ATP-binding protein